jgi:class 3 adenylate cyclase/DNA-binding NarL/FixJ family response regulator
MSDEERLVQTKNSDDDAFVFADESDAEDGEKSFAHQPWKVMIVDDHEGMHAITRLALSDVTFRNRKIDFISAFNSSEALAVLAAHDDVAVMLLDVVMESDDAGLRLVKHLREQLGNREVRIILRTGQPGQAPARRVVQEYDIDAYEPKTGLTSERLFTTIISAFRAYEDIMSLKSSRQGLNLIVEAASSVFKLQTIEGLTEETLKRVAQILALSSSKGRLESGFIAQSSQVRDIGGRGLILCGIGSYADKKGLSLNRALSEDTFNRINGLSSLLEEGLYWNGGCLFMSQAEDHAFYLCIEHAGTLNDIDKNLLGAFWGNVAIAFETLVAHYRIVELKESYSRFAPNDAVTFLEANDITEVKLGDNQKRDMSILFLDIRSFVSLTGEMSPTDCFKFINSYLHHIGGCVNGNFGVVNKYLGDGLMAIFSRENKHANDAVLCSMALLEATEAYNRIYRKDSNDKSLGDFVPRIPLKVGIGIHSGPVVAGVVGYTSRLEFTLLGETVNIASRIEALTKFCGCDILIHEHTAALLPDSILVRRLPPFGIRGKRDPILLWEVFGSDPSPLRKRKSMQLDKFHEAVDLLAGGRPEDAREIFEALAQENPDDGMLDYQLRSLTRRVENLYSRREDLIASDNSD